MKKVLFVLVILVALLVLSIYIFIPGEIRISRSVTIDANKDALFRRLSDAGTWKDWWPDKQGIPGSPAIYSLQDMEVRPGPPKTISIPIDLTYNGITSHCEITFIPLNTDSTTVSVETIIAASYNPFKRVKSYFAAKKIEGHLTSLLDTLRNYYARTANLYGYDIRKERVVDSTLIFTSEEVKGYPSIAKIYGLVDDLKTYVKKNDARETGFPMLNIYTADSINYLLKVAIPIDKKLPGTGKISYKWMLGGGNILITEVRGGPYEIKKAYEQVLHYVSDYRRLAPAISFESMVTDRRAEPDTSKWVTKIYYPVM